MQQMEELTAAFFAVPPPHIALRGLYVNRVEGSAVAPSESTSTGAHRLRPRELQEPSQASACCRYSVEPDLLVLSAKSNVMCELRRLFA